MIPLRSSFLLLFPLFILLTGIITASAQEQDAVPPAEHAHMNMVSTIQTVAANVPIPLIFEQLIEPGWHTYWKNPGDSGTPLSITFTLPDGGQASPLSFPVPGRITVPPLVNFGYSNRALYTATITPPPSLTSETFTIQAKMEWLVCNNICLPETQTQTLILPVTGDQPTHNPAAAALVTDVTLTHPMTTSWPVFFKEIDHDLILSIQSHKTMQDLLKAGSNITFYPEEWGLIDYASDQTISFSPQPNDPFIFKIKRGERPLDQISETKGLLVITDAEGRAQGYEINALRQEGARLGRSTPSSQGPDKENNIVIATPENHNQIKDPLDLYSLPYMIAIAFLAGIILNLMPCVFPILFLKVLAIAKLSEHEQKQARQHGLLYGTGVVVSFWFIAGLLILLQAMGQSVGWGFQLQNPLFVTFLFYLFCLIGLSLFGFFDFDLARFIPSRFHSLSHGTFGSFWTGVLSTVVATPCTAPFMATAMGYALTQPFSIGFFILTAMGIGLASPFIAITFIPSIRHFLPKPGAWMSTLRQVLAFPMFLTAIWLLWVLTQQTGADGGAIALLGVLGLILIIWLMRLRPKQAFLNILRFVLIGILALCLWAGSGIQLYLEGSISGARLEQVNASFQKDRQFEQPYTPQYLADALSGDNPVFVNMTAAWCITCKVNEKMALSTTRVKNLMATRHITYIKGDWTRYNPDITAYLATFDRQGVPLYVFYGNKDPQTGQRPAPIVLPQILTTDLLIQTFQK